MNSLPSFEYTYLAVVFCSHILNCTVAQLWSHVSVCPSTLVVQVTEILRGNCNYEVDHYHLYTLCLHLKPLLLTAT